MSELDSLIEEAQDILANGQNSPFRPVVLLRMFIRLAQEVERIDRAQSLAREDAAGTGGPSLDAGSGAAHSRPAAKKSSQRKRAGTEPQGHTSHAG
jgi:hypothetical protein